MDNNYVSRYRACEDWIIVRDIILNHLDSIKLFNVFLIILIIDLTYKTNKYIFPLLEIISVTSTEKTYFVGFAFFDSEKEKNVTWDLEVCRKMLKDEQNSLKVIDSDRDTTLMNSIVKVSHTSYELMCR